MFLQRRAWNVLLANAYNELPNREVHSISVAQLGAKLGFNDKHANQSYLKESLRSLRYCEVEWNILEKDKEVEWGVAGLLAEVRIKEGICFYQFPHTLRLNLYNPRIYTKLNLRLQNRFASQYALVLWEVCFDYFDIARNEGETPFIPLEKFRELLGVESDEYPAFSIFNRAVIKPAIKGINELTDYHVETEQKRIGRKVGELKFRISRPPKQLPSAEPTQEVLSFDIDDLPPVALELIGDGVSRKEALRIANQAWDAVDTDALPDEKPDFAVYVEEKIGLARYATDVKNAGGFIVEAIRENYQDPEHQKQLQAEKAKERQAMLDALKSEMQEKQRALLRQAVRQTPALVEQAAARIDLAFIRERFEDYDTLEDAYHAGGMVTGAINSILAEELCKDLIAPVVEAYEDEKARILGAGG